MSISYKDALQSVLDCDETAFEKLVSKLSDTVLSPKNNKLFFYRTRQSLNQVMVSCGDRNQQFGCTALTTFPISSLFGYFRTQKPNLSEEHSRRLDSLVESRSMRQYFAKNLDERSSTWSEEKTSLFYGYLDKLLSASPEHQAFMDSLSRVSLFSDNDESRNLREFFDMISVSISLLDENFEKDLFYSRRTDDIMDNFVVRRFLLPNLDTFNKDPYKTISKDQQPRWIINPELRSYIYAEFPQNSSDDEKIFYIYTKLCEALSWDIGFTYNRNHDISPYTSDVPLPHLESLKPGSSVTCKEIAYAFATLINLQYSNAEAIILSYQRDNHHSIWVRTDSMSVELDPFGIPSPYNDNSCAQIGLPIVPDKVFFEKRPGYVSDCIDQVSQIIDRTNTSSIADLVVQVHNAPRSLQNLPINLQDKLESFAKSLGNQKRIDANTVTLLFANFNACGNFGYEREYALIDKFPTSNSGIERIICIKDDSSQGAHNYILFNASDLSISPKTRREVISMLTSREYDLENPAYPVPDL